MLITPLAPSICRIASTSRSNAVSACDPVSIGSHRNRAAPPISWCALAASLITAAHEPEAGGKITYIPYTGGGPTSVQLAGKHIEGSTANPSEEIASWRAGNARPLCVLSAQRMAYTAKITADMAWSDVPTCGEQGVKLTYNMLRGMFMPGKVSPAQQAYYVGLFKRVLETPEWKAYVERNALLPDYRDGAAFVEFLTQDEQRHKELMARAGFLAQ